MTKAAATAAKPARRSAGSGAGGGVAKPAARKPTARKPAAEREPRKVPSAAASASAAAAVTTAAAGAAPQAMPGKPARPPTAFESRLYAVIKRIPPGRVATYGALAEVLGSAPRACGQVRRCCGRAPAAQGMHRLLLQGPLLAWPVLLRRCVEDPHFRCPRRIRRRCGATPLPPWCRATA